MTSRTTVLLGFIGLCGIGVGACDSGSGGGHGGTDARPDTAAADAAVPAPDSSAAHPDADPCGAAVLGNSCTDPGEICGSEQCMQACGLCNLLRCDGGIWRRLEVPPPQQPCDAAAG